MKSRSATSQPCFRTAALIASEGWECSCELSGPAVWPGAPTVARIVRPFSSAKAREVTTSAAAPSDRGEELPAVMVPSFANAGRRAPSDSAVVSGRTPSSWETTSGSPLRCGISTGAISPSKTPSDWARAARWCEAAATSSCSARAMFRSPLPDSVSSPMASWLRESVRPSHATASSMVAGPYLKPLRAPGSRCGALVMDS